MQNRMSERPSVCVCVYSDIKTDYTFCLNNEMFIYIFFSLTRLNATQKKKEKIKSVTKKNIKSFMHA